MTSASSQSTYGAHLFTWLAAVRLQRDRATQPGTTQIDAECDSLLFVMALRQVARAAELCRDLDPSRVDRALNAFTHAVPHWLELRDIIEHFDAYEKRKGNLQVSSQKGKRPAMGSVVKWFEFDGRTRRVVMSGFVVDIEAASAAAEQLVSECLDAVHGA